MDKNKFIELGQVDKREFDLGEVKVVTVPPKTEEVVVEPSKQEQTILPSEGKYIDKVVARAVTNTIDENIKAINIRQGVSILGVEGNLEPNKPNQEKSVVPSETEQRVVADIGYELEAVNVGAIQTEDLVANENGNYIATQGKYIKNVRVDVPVPDLSATTATENDVASGKVFFNSSGERAVGTYTDRLQWKCDNMKTLQGEFQNYKGESLDEVLIGLDTSNVTSMFNTFASCVNLLSIPPLNTINVTYMNQLFMYDYMINTIPLLDMVSVIASANVNNMFYECRNLINLTLRNIRVPIQIGSGTSWGHLLTVDSLINTIKELWDYSSSSVVRKLTMGTTNKNKLSKLYVKLITPTAEQIESDPYINNKLPCEVCESTDEGAMLIDNYAQLKNWSIL